MKWPKSIDELPSQPTYVIIEIESVSYDDPYERPGCGATVTTRYPSIISFDNEEEWKAEIAKRMDVTQKFYQKKEFRAYKMIPAEVRMSINIEVKAWQS